MTAATTIRLAAIRGSLCLSSGSTFAQDCPDQTQTGPNQCAAESYAKADEALNRAYKEIVRKLKGQDESAALFVKAQRSWLAFRDWECSFLASGVAGGGIQPMIQSMCLEQVTNDRVKQPRNYLKCEEGDLCYPVPPG